MEEEIKRFKFIGLNDKSLAGALAAKYAHTKRILQQCSCEAPVCCSVQRFLLFLKIPNRCLSAPHICH